MMSGMQGRIILQDGTSQDATPEAARALRGAGTFFWLDLEGLDAQGSAFLQDELGFHPLAVSAAEEFGQRPKVDEYDDFTFFVLHGPGPAYSRDTVEVHVFYATHHVVTVHRDRCPQLEAARQRIAHHKVSDLSPPEIGVLYVVADELFDSFFPVLSGIDDRIDTLEEAILRLPTEEQLGELFEMKRGLVALRKVVTPQRDMFAVLLSGARSLPGMTLEDERYFRDLYDHLIRVSDLVDSYRDLLTGAMDTHLSTVSNRLNVVMKQLTIIATVFLPLGFLTGFFGQNFSVLTAHLLTQTWSFWVFGIALEVAAAAVLLWFFRRRGWLGGPTA
jgi:magnesium transporter